MKRTPGGRILAVTFAALFSICTCYAQSNSVSSTAQANAKLQTLPDSPPIRAFKAWLEAFNSGDRTLMDAYYREYEPGKSADDIMPFRNQTGGFELLDVLKEESLHVEFVDSMERLINGLLGQYEKGALSRRELLGALAALSVTGWSAAAAQAGFGAASINHVSITGSNLQRTVDFYSRVFNLPRQSQGQANLVQIAVGKAGHLSIRQGAKPGFDHFAIGIEGFNKDRVIADLRARGATPIDGGDGAGLHVADPDGLLVQVIANGGTG